MKLFIKWSGMTQDQRKSVLLFHKDELDKKEIFEHNLNTRRYQINAYNGSVIFHKDF